MKISCFRDWDLKPAKLKYQHFFSSTAKLKCRKIKFLDQSAKLKKKKKKIKKLVCKNQSYQNAFFMFYFLELGKLEMLFQKQDFYIWMKRKSKLGNFYNPNGEKHEIGTFYIEPFISICTRENYSQVFFCWKFTLIPRCYIHVRV